MAEGGCSPPPTLRVGAAQFPVGRGPASNADEVCSLVEASRAAGARLVVFPETALSGYTPAEFPDLSAFDWEALEGATERVREAAAAAGLWVVLGTVTRSGDPDRPRNSALVLAPDGSVHGRYDKRLLARTELAHFEPGTSPLLFEVDGYRCGLAICHEWRYPEVFREYARLGADAVLHCWYDGAYEAEAWEREGRGLMEVIPATARAHAVCNHLWVVGSNTSRAHSAFAPFVVRPDGGIEAAGERERTEVVIADLSPPARFSDGSAHHRLRLLEGARGPTPAEG